ncbi:hypothetical protein HK16_10300 [Acetobacter senegalensis]|uniref:DUF4034 domain-containing protein n=2 Tax=Acetobacter TaxID=434 RepID=A0A252EIY3_9PROT|nr:MULTISPECIES: DUF6624 domain-containing protein [Acetobacter]ATJ90837.1 hypothetical protein CIW82_09180 [Acetobacter tropicalis]OUL66428.1 hypothetical protein HK16_10300 [Acetobacter senegalensis]
MARRDISLRVIVTALMPLLGAAAPPPSLVPFITKDNFNAGDYEFARGAFPDAKPEQIASWNTIKSYVHACEQDAGLAEDAQLKDIGVKAVVPRNRGYQDHLCGQVSLALPSAKAFKNWDSFQKALKRSLPYYQTYEAALTAASNAIEVDSDSQNLTEQITARIIPDQGWRYPMMGTLDTLSGLDTETSTVLQQRILMAMFNTDWDNSQWVRGILKAHGWTNIVKTGKKSSRMMWLLIQHADNDPALQVMALRQIEPLMKTGQFDKADYALLTDRVSLATVGTQYYGSQLSCQHNHYAPFSLDAKGSDPKVLDARRASMGLMSEAKYLTYLPPHC